MANNYMRRAVWGKLETPPPSSRPILIYFEFRSKPSLITVICMNPHSPNKFKSIAIKYCFPILREDTSFFFLIISLFFVFLCYFTLLLIFTKIILLLLFYYIFFHENYFYFCMFRDVPGCSGMFRNVPECSMFLILSTAKLTVTRLFTFTIILILSAQLSADYE